METGMLDGLFGTLNIGADIEIKEQKETKDHQPKDQDPTPDPKPDDPENLPKDMSPYNMYGEEFDKWVRENRPDFKRAE